MESGSMLSISNLVSQGICLHICLLPFSDSTLQLANLHMNAKIMGCPRMSFNWALPQESLPHMSYTKLMLIL